MRLLFVTFTMIALFLPGAAAQNRASANPGPAPYLTARNVVAIQLQALQNNDVPAKDAGIAQVWKFAHPDNKRMTGPLPRFARMIKSAHYAICGGGGGTRAAPAISAATAS